MEMEFLPRDAELGDRYLISCYLVNTIFTTVGFGDIVPANQTERIYFIIVMHVVSLLTILVGSIPAPVLPQMNNCSRPACVMPASVWGM